MFDIILAPCVSIVRHVSACSLVSGSSLVFI